MTVKEVVEKLSKLDNQDAEVKVCANNCYHEFSFSFGGGCDDGTNSYKTVSFYVDELCQSEE